VKAQCKPGGGNSLHLQIELSAGGYVSGEVTIPADKIARVAQAMEKAATVISMGGSGVGYLALTVTPQAILLGNILVFDLTVTA